MLKKQIKTKKYVITKNDNNDVILIKHWDKKGI